VEFIKLDLEQLKRDYESGLSLRHLATKYGTSKLTVRRKLQKMGIKTLSSSEALKNVDLQKISARRFDDEEILKAYKTNNVKQLAKMFETTSEAIMKILNRNGIKIEVDYSELGRKLADSVKQSWDCADFLLNLYLNEKLSCEEIADLFNVDPETIRGKLEKYEIKRRTIGESSSLAASKPENQKTRSEAAKKLWDDPLYVQKIRRQIPNIKQKCSEAIKKAWERSDYREKVLAKMANWSHTSNLEHIINGILDDLHIEHKKIRPGGYEFDVAVEADQLKQSKGLLLEINGLYWHTKKGSGEKDEEKRNYWLKNLSDQYRFETLWEHEFSAHCSIFQRLLDKLVIPLQQVDFEISSTTVKEINSGEAEKFYNKYHYLTSSRSGRHYGAFQKDKLIACASFSHPTRMETAERLKVGFNEVRELTRFCICPIYQKKNLASHFLSRAVSIFKKAFPDVKKLISFADQTVGHVGTIYLASGWKEDGETAESYHYAKDGMLWHKRTIWQYAKSIGMTENTFIDFFGIQKIDELPKKRFLLETI
jgi:predicted DNA-binding protein YlxM (UPF0122 family)